MIISGIQQVGIGVTSLKEAWRWYRDNFGMDVRVFDEAAPANYMLPYTGGKPCERHAALTVNMMGGGGFEIWQYTDREPQPPKFDIQMGDLGIFSAKIKSPDVDKAYEKFQKMGLTINGVSLDPAGRKQFFMKDPYGNIFQVIEADIWYKFDSKKLTGAAYGVLIGCTDIKKSMTLYSDILGYDEVVYDETKVWDDLATIPGGTNKIRRVLLRHTKQRKGFFSALFGPTEIELVKAEDRTPINIYKERFWGDLGFIHLCYDINGMDELQAKCEAKGFPFTVDSQSETGATNAFDMGEAAGHFSYVEDPDGTLIEFVETHKIPVSKKLGWYLKLDKRKDKEKPVASWMMSLM
ncbi:MAG: VOC family protein [Spirochaetales bacterium]|jgi:catechol 2,3-dioxygenase-like lactoylglutathione lyase family enzyme|nr:VOC family protein [Spirochaetales bacterium]